MNIKDKDIFIKRMWRPKLTQRPRKTKVTWVIPFRYFICEYNDGKFGYKIIGTLNSITYKKILLEAAKHQTEIKVVQ